jgi:AcrR family transcriptional regulator
MRITTELVAKRGYKDTTAELIVARAKVGYGTFYKYFPDKEAVFLALYEETYAAIVVEMTAAYGSDDSAPWPERVAAAIRCFYEAIAADPPLWRACLVEALTAGSAMLERHEASIKALGAIFTPGRTLAKKTARLPATLENTVAGGVVWIAYQRLIVGEAERLPELVPEAVQFALSPYMGEAAAIAAAEQSALQSAERD